MLRDDIHRYVTSTKDVLSAVRHLSTDRTLNWEKGIFQGRWVTAKHQEQPCPGAFSDFAQFGNTHNWTRNPSKAIGARLPWSTLGTNWASLPRRSFQTSFTLDARGRMV